jgi:multiple sugar transport system permease protein
MAEIAVPRRGVRRRWSTMARREAMWGILMLLPSLLGFLVFYWLPILAGFALSLTHWDLLSPIRWAGLSNFQRLTTDTGFHDALLHTVLFTIGSVPVSMALALAVALALNQRLRGTTFYRTAYFLPVVSMLAAVALVWQWMYWPVYGLINNIVGTLGLPQPFWLSNPNTVLLAIMIVHIWLRLGYDMVLFLAGLQGIPRDFYEAASVDGAGRWTQFRHITLPLLSPTTFLILILSMINAFQVFDLIYIMTGRRNPGGPGGAAVTMVFYIYNNAFIYSRMGYASALALVLFIIIFMITIVQLRLQRRWVHYG